MGLVHASVFPPQIFMLYMKGNPKVLTVHGDDKACIKFAEEIHEKIGFEAYSPELDEVISV